MKKSNKKKVRPNKTNNALMHTQCNDCKIQLIVKFSLSDKCNLCGSINIVAKEWTRG